MSTYRRASRLPGVVAALEAQDLAEPYEIVVVDDGSPDDTWATLERLAASCRVPLRPFRQTTNQGPARGRNRGWREARGAVVAFTDDDCRATPGWLRSLVDALADAELAQGRTLADPDHADRWGPFSRTLQVTREQGFYETCNIAYRRTLLEAMAGFDETFALPGGEDTDLAWRARERGARTAFVPEALVYHEVTPSDYREYLRNKLRWADIPRVVRLHPQLREGLFYSRWFWRSSHPKALALAAGAALVVVPGRTWRWRAVRWVAAGALARPYLRFRTRVAPLRAGPRRRLALIPLAWVGDLLEVAVMIRGSIRHRTLIL